MTAPAAGTSTKLLIFGGASAGVGLLLKLILPLTYGSLDKDRAYDNQPWETEKFGAAFTSFLGAPSIFPGGGGVGLADCAVIFGAVAIALALAIRGFEPQVPKPVAPAYPQQQYAQPGQYAQQQAPQQPSAQYPQAQPQSTPYPPQPEQGGYPTQQQWGG
ncbi:MAG: hypothetical protein FWF02_08560 [Micrococcales bacterium]|nr:hypothetical protein [Micrococcales bacterium]MCL2667739.1 hypothetical protein [Micrococcales bacterium]